jgi:hypothetical protein
MALLSPVSADAQARLVPQGGLYASVSGLGTVESIEGARDVGERETSLALGLSLDMGYARSLGLRLTGLYGTDSEVPVEGIGCTGTACELRSTMLGLSASLVFRPVPAGFPIRPYILGGGGLKRYEFDPGADAVLKDVFGEESKGAVVWGVGFDWSLAILKGNLELTDYVSGSVLDDGDSMHDLFLTIGLFLG